MGISEFLGRIIRVLKERLTAVFGKNGMAFRVALMALALCVAVSSCSAGVSQTDDDEAENSVSEEDTGKEDNISNEDGDSEDAASVNAVSINSRNYDPEKNVTISGVPDSDSREFLVDNERFRLWKAEPGDSAGRGVSLNVVTEEQEYDTYFMEIAVEPESNYVGFKPTWDFEYDDYGGDTITSISDEALENNGLAKKAALDEYYTSLLGKFYDNVYDAFFRIRIYAGKELDGTVITFDGELKDVQEIWVNDMRGLYFSVDSSETGRHTNSDREQHMLLYSEDTNSLIEIYIDGSSFTCNSIAQIAAGLELLDTGIEAEEALHDCLSISGSVG